MHVGNAVQKGKDDRCKWEGEETIANTPCTKHLDLLKVVSNMSLSVVIEDHSKKPERLRAGLFTEGRQRLHAGPQRRVF